MPNLYIIASCNGAGKTTASFTVLPEMLNCWEFVNADEIAKGLSPFQPEKAAFESGRIMLHRISELLEDEKDSKFDKLYIPRVDYWVIFDNTSDPMLIAEGINALDFNINNPDIWAKISHG